VVLSILSYVQNFRTIGQGVFVRLVTENGMFPLEREIVLNTVISAMALARDSGQTKGKNRDFALASDLKHADFTGTNCGISEN
jgi:hypothetical protein